MQQSNRSHYQLEDDVPHPPRFNPYPLGHPRRSSLTALTAAEKQRMEGFKWPLRSLTSSDTASGPVYGPTYFPPNKVFSSQDTSVDAIKAVNGQHQHWEQRRQDTRLRSLAVAVAPNSRVTIKCSPKPSDSPSGDVAVYTSGAQGCWLMFCPTDTLFIMQALDKDGTYPDAFFPKRANIMYRLACTGIDFSEHMFERGGRTDDVRVSVQLSRPAQSRPEDAHRLYHPDDVRAASQEATHPYLTTDGALGFMFRCRPKNIPTKFLDNSIQRLDLGARFVSAKLLEAVEPGNFVLHISGSVVSIKVNDKAYRNFGVDSGGKPQRQRPRQKQSGPYRNSFYIRPSRDTAVFLAFDERYKTASGVYWSTPSSANIVRAVWSDNQQDMPRPPDLAPNEFRVCIKVSESKADGHFLWSGGAGQSLPHMCLSTTGAMFIAFNCCAGDARYIAGKVQNMLM